MREGAYCLVARVPGDYKLQLHGRVPYATSRARGVVLSVPYAVTNTLKFSVREVDVELNAVPSISPAHHVSDSPLCNEKYEKDVLESDASDSRRRKRGSASSGAKWSTLECDVPPTRDLSVQWKERIEEEELEMQDEEVEREVIVNVDQSVLHSIGEGIVVRVICHRMGVIGQDSARVAHHERQW